MRRVSRLTRLRLGMVSGMSRLRLRRVHRLVSEGGPSWRILRLVRLVLGEDVVGIRDLEVLSVI